MREIKFRAWIRDGEWEEDGSQQKYIMCYDLAFEDYEPINDLLAGVENLMQFTGLKDKEGKEIWEGDILGNNEGEPTAEIVYEEGSFRDKDGVLLVNHIYHSAKIIGNRFENPDLLK